ncbi:hypothetical protein V500_02826 [Pseudogymnoascus sp. VKM F-4518 (FW-2643)]|nr:hypothetical protein V500_02826 [Pseudogymnoascus sp. VKM F-4518 (FW-2643)]
MVRRVLLTGANGFIGSHILSVLLSKGFSVRSVVRSQAKLDQMRKDFPGYSNSQLDFALVPNITAPGAYEKAVVSTPPFDTVIHAASPFLYRIVNDNSEFLVPALNGTKEILKAVKALAPSVTRVIITGSCAAVVDHSSEAAKPATAESKKYTEDDWNPDSWETAMAGTLNVAYRASKTFAEKAAWDFLETEKPNFDLVVLNPPMVYGPIRHSVPSPKELNESTARIYTLFIEAKADDELPPNGMPSYVDVRDLADAHWLAATTPAASNTRMIICGGRASSQDISDALREKIPELRARTPKGVPGGNPLAKNAYSCSSERAQKVLGLKFRSREETFVGLARQLLDLEAKSAA